MKPVRVLDTIHDVAIVTVSYNAFADGFLRSLKNVIDASPLSIQCIVIDNASTKIDAKKEVHAVIPEAQVVLRDDNYGFGNSCNFGARIVNAKYLFFLNPDTILCEADVIDKLHTFMKSCPRKGIIAPKVTHFSGELQETCRRFPDWYMPVVQRTRYGNTSHGRGYVEQFLMRDYNHERRRMVDWVQGSALLIQSELFYRISGFDERFWMYFEDIDLCRRVWLEGLPVYYYPDVCIQHAHGKASGKERNHLKNILKNRVTREHIKSWGRYVFKWRRKHWL